MSGPPAQPRVGETRRMLHLLGRFTRGSRRTFVVAFGLLALEATTAVFEPLPLAYLIDYLKGDSGGLQLPFLPSGRTGTVLALTLAILLIAAVNSLTDSLAEIALAQGGRKLGYNLRTALFAHLQRLSLAFHDRRRTGDVITRVTGDVNEIENFVTSSVSDFVGSVMLLVGALAVVAYTAWQVALVALTIVPVLALISRYFSTRIKNVAKEQRAYQGELASSSQEMLTSIRVVQIFGRGGQDEKRFANQSRQAMDASLELARLEALFSFVVSLFQAISIGVVIWIGIWLVDLNALTVGTLVFLILLIKNMFRPTRRIIKEWNTVGKLYASVERVGELLEREPAVRDAPNAVPASRLSGDLEFQNVSFAYQLEPEDLSEGEEVGVREALRNVSFHVPAGSTVALVGHSGAGKTTIAQLIPRLYDTTAGSVLVDGQDVRGLTLESLRSQISMVLQEPLLLSGTVADNIAYGRPGATHDEIVAAAIHANAHEFIQQMPDAYDTDLTERASNLSGGQRQRIAIARAFIRGTPILILDEPTTGLDTESTELVIDALRPLMKGKTTLMISHDLDLVRSADRILVFKSGEIVQTGKHEELIEEGGLYAELYAKRSGAPRRRTASGPAGVVANGRRRECSLDPAELDPLRNARLLTEFPDLHTALNGDEMADHLEHALLGDGSQIEKCTPMKALYSADGDCTLRYRLEIRDPRTNDVLNPLVGARLFRSGKGEASGMHRRLVRLAAIAADHKEMAAFATPVAALDTLPMVAHAFPIDPALPTLVHAANSRSIGGVLQSSLPDDFVVDSCYVGVAHYPRAERCLLRYDVEGTLDGEPVRETLFGKVGVRYDPRTASVLSALRAAGLNDGHSFRVPRLLAFRPELDLALFEAIPGTPRVAKLIRGCAMGKPGATPQALGEAIARCALIAAALHGSEVKAYVVRTFEGELTALRAGLEALEHTSPRLADRLGEWANMATARCTGADPLRLCLAHGDFTHSQVLFDGETTGLVDFDTISMAEPALDLGRFSAYLRVGVRKAMDATPPDVSTQVANEMCESFIGVYRQASHAPAHHDAQLVARACAYESLTLLQMAIRSWRQLKPARTAIVLEVLEERMG